MLDEKGFIVDDLVNARQAGNFSLTQRSEIQYMDVSPKQLVSVAAQVSRTDSGQTNTPHEAVNRWSAQVGLNPFTTLGAALTYSGQYGQLLMKPPVTSGLVSPAVPPAAMAVGRAPVEAW